MALFLDRNARFVALHSTIAKQLTLSGAVAVYALISSILLGFFTAMTPVLGIFYVAALIGVIAFGASVPK